MRNSITRHSTITLGVSGPALLIVAALAALAALLAWAVGHDYGAASCAALTPAVGGAWKPGPVAAGATPSRWWHVAGGWWWGRGRTLRGALLRWRQSTGRGNPQRIDAVGTWWSADGSARAYNHDSQPSVWPGGWLTAEAEDDPPELREQLQATRLGITVPVVARLAQCDPAPGLSLGPGITIPPVEDRHSLGVDEETGRLIEMDRRDWRRTASAALTVLRTRLVAASPRPDWPEHW